MWYHDVWLKYYKLILYILCLMQGPCIITLMWNLLPCVSWVVTGYTFIWPKWDPESGILPGIFMKFGRHWNKVKIKIKLGGTVLEY